MSSPRICGLCLREQDRPEFSQSLNLGESLKIFQVPELIWRRQKSDSSHFASLGASPTGCIRRKRKLGIFTSPRVYIKGERSEFFQVPRPIYRRFAIQLYWHISSYFPCISSYFLHIFLIFLHILTCFMSLFLPTPPTRILHPPTPRLASSSFI